MDLHTMLMTIIIALMAILTGLGFIFNVLLVPVKENQAKTDKRLDHLEKGFENLNAKFENLNAKFENSNAKLDQLLARPAR